MNEVTRILATLQRGEARVSASEQLLPLVYDELRRLAAQRLAREKPGLTLQPTALVHEAYLRLIDSGSIGRWDSRGHFFAAASEARRRIAARIRRARRHERGGLPAGAPGLARGPGRVRAPRPAQGQARRAALL